MAYRRRDLRRAAFLGAFLMFVGCGGDSGGTGPTGDPPLFPALLSDLESQVTSATAYAPAYELWTNGMPKSRRVYLPDGATIDNSNGNVWLYPEGTRFLKTFSVTPPGSATPRPVETRVIVRRAGRWEVAAYQWRQDGSDADLLPGGASTRVDVVDATQGAYTHIIPSRGDCGQCHARSPAFILGFSEIQLNHGLPGASFLERFAARGAFAQPLPSDPASVPPGDSETRAILGYVQANCVHCHNASSGNGDFSPDAFLASTVRRKLFSDGRLIDPGLPDQSLIYLRVAGGTMPPLGVQKLDGQLVDRLRAWILTHDFDAGS